MTGPDESAPVCPFHDLPPGDTVWIDVGGTVLPYSVERACDYWHLAETLRPVLDRAEQDLARYDPPGEQR